MNDQSSQPKRILYVENGIGYGGAIICLRHLVRNLDRNRFTSMVVTGRTGPQYREIEDEAYWKHIPDRHFDTVGAHRKLDKTQWPEKIPGMRFLINQALGRADDVGNFTPFFLQLLWTAWRFKADLIHANNEPLCNRAALLVGKVLQIPTVCHVRGNLDGSSHLMKWTFGLPDHFTPVSHWVSEGIQNNFDVPSENVSVIYDGLELEKLNTSSDGAKFRSEFNIPQDAFTVGLVGLLIPWKGQEIFLDAAKILKETIPSLKMVIIGGTPDECIPFEKMLRQRVKNERLNEIIIFTGHTTDMSTVYNGLDVVVSASTSPEPLGTVVIESMAMGRPLIGPNHGGAAEMMEHEKTGLLFEPGNADDLALVISQFYDSVELRENLGKSAREHALKTFAVEEHVRHVQKVYTDVFRNFNQE